MVRWKSASASGPLRPTTRPAVPTPAQVTAMRSSPSDRAASTAAWTEPLVADVGRHEPDPLAQLLGQRRARRGRQVDDDDLRAVGGEPAGGRAAQAGRTAGDERDGGVGDPQRSSPQVFFSSWREMTRRWIWLVPSKIWVTFASRKYRSSGKSCV